MCRYYCFFNLAILSHILQSIDTEECSHSSACCSLWSIDYFCSHVCSFFPGPAGVRGREGAVCVSHDAGGGFLLGPHQRQHWRQSGGAQTRYCGKTQQKDKRTVIKSVCFRTITPLSDVQVLCQRAVSSSCCWTRRSTSPRYWNSAEQSSSQEEPCSL